MKKIAETTNLNQNNEYKTWLKDLKHKVLQAQIKAVVQVNTALLKFYWELGREIVERQRESSWGDGFLKQLSHDLMAEFPDMKGFSERNLKYVRQWFLFYSGDESIGQQAVAQLTQIPWGHNRDLFKIDADLDAVGSEIMNLLQEVSS